MIFPPSQEEASESIPEEASSLQERQYALRGGGGGGARGFRVWRVSQVYGLSALWSKVQVTMGSGPECTCTEICVGILSVADQQNAVWMGYIPLTVFNRSVTLISTIMQGFSSPA